MTTTQQAVCEQHNYCVDIYYVDGPRVTVFTHSGLSEEEARQQVALHGSFGHSTALYCTE